MLPLLPLTQTQETDNNEKKLALSVQSKVCVIYPRASEMGSSAYMGNKPCAPPAASSTLLHGHLTTPEPRVSIVKGVVFNSTDGILMNIDLFI